MRSITLLSAVLAILLSSPSTGVEPASDRTVRSPVRPAEALTEATGVRVQFDAADYDRVKDKQSITLRDFPLEPGLQVELELERFEVFTEDATIILGGPDGQVELERPDVVHFRGKVSGRPDSDVVISLSPHGNNGVIHTDGKRYIVSSGRPGDGADDAVFDLDSLADGAIRWRDFDCGAEAFQPGVIEPGDFNNGGVGVGVVAGDIDGGAGLCQSARIAVETDYEFTQDLFGGDAAASTAYAASLMAAISNIYRRDVGPGLEISFLRVWTTPQDPWRMDNAILQLEEFRTHWQVLMSNVNRSLAHFLSGRALHGAGGVAYLEGLCEFGLDYGLSAHLNGSFPTPLQPGSQNWDLVVVAHELGHNFGAPHTHSMSPPIDGCAFGQCLGASAGTIMSYCHTCPGGISNINLMFHPRILNERVGPYVANRQGCMGLIFPPTVTGHPSSVTACERGSASFSVATSGSGTFSYQWQRNGVDIEGATTNPLVMHDLTVDDSANFRVLVINSCEQVYSFSAALDVQVGQLGDVNCDQIVNIEDLLQLIGGWGPCPANASCPEDFDGSGTIGVGDLLELLGHWS